MVCDICGKDGTCVRKISRTYGKGKRTLVIENIPFVTCPHCGESYLEADTLHEIERIKHKRKSSALERQVAVANFG
ncbi:MAG: type II toxin-antitoxin system MqsA family antitoxin [Nitrospirae bacterium]|nr:type II toxin-antitoxin system MqsA family antitoxin [Nitrospirota bacterium]